jgi:hypothetical protein
VSRTTTIDGGCSAREVEGCRSRRTGDGLAFHMHIAEALHIAPSQHVLEHCVVVPHATDGSCIRVRSLQLL